MKAETLPEVTEQIYRALDIPTDTPESMQRGVTEVFGPAFFDRDVRVVGEEIKQKVTVQLFPDGGKQAFTPTAEEWRHGLIDFGVRTVRHLEPIYNGSSDQVAGEMGQILVVLLGMTKPAAEVGITSRDGITQEGLVLGRVSERTHLLLEYADALENGTTIFPSLTASESVLQ